MHRAIRHNQSTSHHVFGDGIRKKNLEETHTDTRRTFHTARNSELRIELETPEL